MKFIKYMIAAENIENVLVIHFSQKTYSFVPNCRKWGWGDCKLEILGKNVSSAFNYYKRMT